MYYSHSLNWYLKQRKRYVITIVDGNTELFESVYHDVTEKLSDVRPNVLV